VTTEDALKHLYHSETRGIPSTVESLSGAVGISADAVSGLVVGLERHSLARMEGQGFVLTEEGRAYALRVIRTHRLWERYLADETGLHETEWHPDAEKKEHHLTPTEVDTLSARMGNPLFDPHGDPIPTTSGYLPAQTGRPMTQMGQGELGQVVHIEDEPEVVYSQIVDLGLFPGMLVRILETSPRRIRFDTEGTEAILPPFVAANITVVPVSEVEPVDTDLETLDSLVPGESARVVGITRKCRGQQRRRLMDLGVLPGTVIRAEMRSPGGDPTAYLIRGATIALRSNHTGMITITRKEMS
jgi:DtxR family Mn-dependent transcriptional regulator